MLSRVVTGVSEVTAKNIATQIFKLSQIILLPSPPWKIRLRTKGGILTGGGLGVIVKVGTVGPSLEKTKEECVG